MLGVENEVRVVDEVLWFSRLLTGKWCPQAAEKPLFFQKVTFREFLFYDDFFAAI